MVRYDPEPLSLIYRPGFVQPDVAGGRKLFISSEVQIFLLRLFSETSPSARTSKGFSLWGQGLRH